MRERKKLTVCYHCLLGIESHEGKQKIKSIYVDDVDDENESFCDWCNDFGFDVLYEFE